jgi:hypothetical protein
LIGIHLIGLQDREALAGGCPDDGRDKDEQRKDAIPDVSPIYRFSASRFWAWMLP